MHFVYHVCILGTILTLHGSLGETQLTLTASPNDIRPGISPTLKVRCSIGGNSVIKAGVIHVTSISVLRKTANTEVNVTVATVTAFRPPTAHQDLEKLKVIGNTTTAEPYLELTWSNPSAHQTGTYICEVVWLNSEQHQETLTKSVQVSLYEPTPEELLLYIGNLDIRTQDLESRAQDVQGANVQTGTVTCVQGTHDYPIAFSAPYEKVPNVITALAGAQSSTGFAYKPLVLSLNTNGFTLRCNSFGATSIVWMAV